MQTAYSRVTVLTSDRTIDLALPSALPISEVLPQVMRFAGPTDDGQRPDSSPISWTLARVGGTAVPLSQTLSEAGVHDGDVLELRPQAEEIRPAMVEDVRDAVEDSVDAAGGVWTTVSTRSFVVRAGSAALGVAGLAAFLGARSDVASLADLGAPVSAVLAIAVLLLATWWGSYLAEELDAQIAAGVAMGWGALLVAGLQPDLHLGTEMAMGLAAVVVAAVAGVARLLTPATTGHLAFAAVLLAAGIVEMAGAATAIPADQLRRILPVLALLTLGVIPRVSLSVGGLASADYRVRHVGRLDMPALRARYRASNAVLVGATLGVCVVAAGAAVVHLVGGDEWDRTLGLMLGLALVMRSRLFSRIQHMLAPRLTGSAVLVFAGYRWAVENPALLPWAVAALAVVVAAGVGLGSLVISEITRARVKRVLNIVEFLVIVVLLVVCAGSMGLYGQIGGLF